MKKSSILVFVLVVVIICLIAIILWPSGPSDTDEPVGVPTDYFPIEVGTEWTYKITLGEAEPMNYQEVGWPQPGGGTLYYSQTGRFYKAMVDDHPDSFLLKIRVNSVAEEQGPLSYPTGVEVAILQDDFGVFEDVSQLYWAISDPRSKIIIQQVCMYPPDTPGAPSGVWGSWGMEDGYSMRLLLFGEEPGVGMGFEDSPDTLYFVGIDRDVPGYSDTICLHFRREVELSDDGDGSDSFFDTDFTEDTWFAKGIGLVLLEQKVMGQASMTWRLQ